MYADYISPAMKAAIDETNRRRGIQKAYNEEHGITPKSVEKSVRDIIEVTEEAEDEITAAGGKRAKPEELTQKERQKLVARLEKEMKQCAKDLQFERAAELRDIIFEYRVK